MKNRCILHGHVFVMRRYFYCGSVLLVFISVSMVCIPYVCADYIGLSGHILERAAHTVNRMFYFVFTGKPHYNTPHYEVCPKSSSTAFEMSLPVVRNE